MSPNKAVESLLFTFCCMLSVNVVAQGTANQSSSIVGDALRVVFNPVVEPDIKTKGSIQMDPSFFGGIIEIKQKLELALVIDGTSSMEDEIEGIKKTVVQMVQDIRRFSGKRVDVQIVVYRDLASGKVSFPSVSLPVSIPAGEWLTDDDQITKSIEKILPQDGAPYFHECVDEGIYAALTQLKWSDGNDSSRWIFVIGDAPPLPEGFPDGFKDAEIGAKRRYSTSLLITMANKKGIQIHTIVCPTRKKDADKIDKSVFDDLRTFFGDLSSATNGKYLNLLEPSMQSQIHDLAKKAPTEFLPTNRITEKEIDQLKEKLSTQAKAIPRPKMKIAVLPHLKMDEMDFSLNNPGMHRALELRHQLNTAGIETIEPNLVRRAFDRLYVVRKFKDEQFFREFSLHLGANIVLWGSSNNPNEFQSSAYEAGKSFVTSNTPIANMNTAQLCSAALGKLSAAAKSSHPKSQFALSMPTSLIPNTPEFVTRTVGLQNDSSDATKKFENLVIRARAQLEEALGFTLVKDDVPKSKELYKEARGLLEEASKIKEHHPIVLAMQANIEFGEWQLDKIADPKLSSTKIKTARDFAAEAVKYKSSAALADQYEIEADSQFYRQYFKEAVEIYKKQLDPNNSMQPATDQVLRAHWMLLGIYSGNWGVNTKQPELVIPDEARFHALQILAKFPDSPEAGLLYKWLVRTGGSKSQIPHTNPALES